MALDCIITCGGSDRTSHINTLKNPKTAPVKEFIVDLDGLYKAVFKHVIACDKCDASDVLQAYLDNRTRKAKPGNHGGSTSDGLIRLALKYEKARPHQVSKDLVKKFLLRAGDPELVLEHQSRLDSDDMVQFARNWTAHVKRTTGRQYSVKEATMWLSRIRDNQKKPHLMVSPLGFLLEAAAVIVDSGAELPQDATDLMNLAEVAMVMMV
jgi:hypothetical protein